MIDLTCDFCCSLYVLAETGVVAEGEGFDDACLTGRDVHRFQCKLELVLETRGLTGGGPFASEGRRELLSPL